MRDDTHILITRSTVSVLADGYERDIAERIYGVCHICSKRELYSGAQTFPRAAGRAAPLGFH